MLDTTKYVNLITLSRIANIYLIQYCLLVTFLHGTSGIIQSTINCLYLNSKDTKILNFFVWASLAKSLLKYNASKSRHVWNNKSKICIINSCIIDDLTLKICQIAGVPIMLLSATKNYVKGIINSLNSIISLIGIMSFTICHNVQLQADAKICTLKIWKATYHVITGVN